MPCQNPLFSYENLRTVMTYLDPIVRFELSRQCSSLRCLHNIVPMKMQYLRFPYESLRTVMAYLDPLVRLQLSTHCPFLRYLHNIVPLKIQYLRITPTDFKINNTTYKIGIIRKYINRRNPKVIEEENANGGHPFDTDRYGLCPNQPVFESIERLEKQLEINQKTKIQHSANGGREFEKNEEEKEKIQVKLDVLRAKKFNFHPPFYLHVQLLIIPDNGPRKVQCLVYNKTLQEVKDHFMLKLFGTNIPIHVENMNVEGMPGYTLKTPYFPFKNRRMKVSSRRMKVSSDILETLNAIRSVLDGSPLKIIKVSSYEIIPDDPIIQTSKFLNITGYSQLRNLRRFSNERIHLEKCIFTEGDVGDIIEHWQQIGIKIGAYISIGFQTNHHVQKLSKSFRGLSGARSKDWKELRSTTFPECVVLPIGDHSELHVYCETPKSQDAEYCKTEWIVRIKIHDKGFSDNLFID